MNPYFVVILGILLLTGCSTPKHRAKYAKINDLSPTVYIITPEEIESLPAILSTAEMVTRFGRPPRAAIDVGIYARYNPKIDYSKPLGEAFMNNAYLFFPEPENKHMVGVIVTVEKSGFIVVWPKSKAGMSLDSYYEEKQIAPNQAPETTILTVTDRAPSSTLRASEDRVSP